LYCFSLWAYTAKVILTWPYMYVRFIYDIKNSFHHEKTFVSCFLPFMCIVTTSSKPNRDVSGSLTTATGSQVGLKMTRKSSARKQRSGKRSSCKGKDSQLKQTNKIRVQMEAERRSSNNARERWVISNILIVSIKLIII